MKNRLLFFSVMPKKIGYGVFSTDFTKSVMISVMAFLCSLLKSKNKNQKLMSMLHDYKDASLSEIKGHTSGK